MPGMDGVEATRQIREQTPESRVLILTMYDDDATVFTAMKAGAQGYLLKESEQDDIVRAVHAVVAGEAIFGPGVAARVLGYFTEPPQAVVAEYPFPELTHREREVLELLAQGMKNADIATALFLSPKTVSNQLTAIFAKLQVASRGEAIVRAREGGLGTATVSDLFVALATVVPALFFGSGGVALLPTAKSPGGCADGRDGGRSDRARRCSGSVVTSDAASVLLVASLMLPGAMAVLAFPRASLPTRRRVLRVDRRGRGGCGRRSTTRSSPRAGSLGSMAAVTFIALIGHGWWVLETARGGGSPGDALAGAGRHRHGFDLSASSSCSSRFLASSPEPSFSPRWGRPWRWGSVARASPTSVRWSSGSSSSASSRSPTLLSSSAVLAIIDGWTGGETPAGLVAIVGVLLATGFHPLSVVLRGLIDELLFGERPDPFLAASALADQIGDDPLLALRAIRGALMLPYASISIGGVEVAVSGTPVTETRRFPLALGSDETGEIVIGLRPGDLTLSAGDEQALGIVAPLVAQTLRARRLSRDLQESRSAAIKAIEEERRRLRRDLHDGLGPTLSGIAFTADAARNTVTSDPAAADALLLRLRADAVAAVGEIRRLVYDMRPPSLDELGLVAALRQQVSSIRTADGRPMHVQVEANDLPPLPAAVEVAAFRIATEAVLNSARHSGTDRASVHIQHKDDTLEVSVRDPGSGTSAWQPGVGLSSMRERAAEVG